MVSRSGAKFQSKLTVVLVLLISLGVLLLANFFVIGDYASKHSPSQAIHTTQSNQHTTKVSDFYKDGRNAHIITRGSRPPSRITQAQNFEAYVCRGERLLNFMRSADPTQHQWTLHDLESAWTEIPNDDEDFGAYKGLGPVMQELGIPHGARDIHPEHWEQVYPFTDANGQTHPATLGLYQNNFILNSTIVALSNHSPRQAAGLTAVVPALNRWSDVLWFLWMRAAGAGARELRYIFRASIQTPETRELMDYIIGAEPNYFDVPWPGLTFNMTTREGKALLATPHGTSIAYMIADHSDILGSTSLVARMFSFFDEEKDYGTDENNGYQYHIIFSLRGPFPD